MCELTVIPEFFARRAEGRVWGYCSRANMHIRKWKPDAGLGFQVKVLDLF